MQERATGSSREKRTLIGYTGLTGPPGNGKGAVQAPIPKLTCRAQNNSVSAISQVCGHKSTVTVRERGTHYSKEICIVCGGFVRWLPKPETFERQKLNGFKLAKLAMRPELTHWERNFVRSISHRTRLSPKQQQIIDRLCATYLEGKAQ